VQKVASLRKEIFGMASSIAKYASNKRVEAQLNKKAYQPIVSPPKKQESQPVRMTEKPDLLKAASRAREIGNLAKSEHDTEKLRAYKDELRALHKAIEAVAPRSAFNSHKPL